MTEKEQQRTAFKAEQERLELEARPNFVKSQNAPLSLKEADITQIKFTSRGNDYLLFLSDAFFAKINLYDNKTKLQKLKAALEAIN